MPIRHPQHGKGSPGYPALAQPGRLTKRSEAPIMGRNTRRGAIFVASPPKTAPGERHRR